jgi:hypothetical protein
VSQDRMDERAEELPRDPDPPERALEVDKQEPSTPAGAPQPRGPEVESARLLANEAREALTAEGFSDLRIDELAGAFIARNVGQDSAEFLAWARAEGAAGPGGDRVL